MAAADSPIRALHLFGRPPDFQTERAAAALRRDLGAGFDVATRVIGPGGSYWGEHRYPILMDGLASVESVIRKLGGA